MNTPMHPLAGADLATLAKVFRRGGAIAPAQRQRAMAIWAAAIGRLPFTLAEWLWCAASLPKAEALPAPVFILGHWRSGTTHLYQILVEAGFGFVPPTATGLPWDLLFLARLTEKQIEKRLPAKRYIDNIPVRPDSPQEDEIALANMSELSFYHGIYFPSRLKDWIGQGVFFDRIASRDITNWQRTFAFFLRKLHVQQDRKRLLIKNPVYTARAAMLAEMFPQTKFIHIYRNPFDVFLSMRNFYTKLIAEFALQDDHPVDIDEIIISTYDRMMTAMMADAGHLPAGRLAVLRYEDFVAAPMAHLANIWEQLDFAALPDIGPFARHAEKFTAYLDRVKSFEKNRFVKDEAAARLVSERLGHWCDRLGYPRP